ncbi:MAG: ATP-grasp domain-containing protein [Gammaproteobacteria bacterium]|nr:ATP-grasp domain-containing protein [Gammaproteobacteria bacterium]
MKKIIILQNSVIFTLNIDKIYRPDVWELHLIVNQKSYDCLCDRNQQGLFASIKITDDFCFASLKDQVISFIKKSDENIVIATNTEKLVSVAGQLRDYFHIPGLTFQEALLFTDKIAMKKHIEKFNVLTPKYCHFDRQKYFDKEKEYLESVCQQLFFPIIAKPIASAGSQGVCKIHNNYELKRWADSNENIDFELDEYIEGTLYHCDSFVQNGNILFTAICRYSSPVHQFLEGYNLGSITFSNDDPCYQKLHEFNNYILRNISTQFSGVTHLEVFEKADGQLVFLEVANRCGGAGIPRMYNKHLRIDLFSTHFLLQCDGCYQLNITPGTYAAWLQFAPSSNITCLENLPSIESQINLVSKNEKLNTQSNCFTLRDYSLLVVLHNNDIYQLEKDFYKLSKCSKQNSADPIGTFMIKDGIF